MGGEGVIVLLCKMFWLSWWDLIRGQAVVSFTRELNVSQILFGINCIATSAPSSSFLLLLEQLRVVASCCEVLW